MVVRNGVGFVKSYSISLERAKNIIKFEGILSFLIEPYKRKKSQIVRYDRR